MSYQTWRRVVGHSIVVLVVSAAIGVSACSGPRGTAYNVAPTGVPQRYECPLTDSVIVQPPDFPVPATEIDVAGPLSHIPEFHDCQRFILKKKFLGITIGWKYDAMYAVFASFRLDSLWVGTGLGGPPSKLPCPQSRVVVNGDPCYNLQAGDSVPVEGNGFPFAEVVSWSGTYSDLGVQPGYNCLYLFDPAAPKAFMVAQGPSNGKCAQLNSAPSPAPNVTQLSVRLNVIPTYAPGDYPPVARWDWDRRNAKQYIVIRCGAASCDVGREALQASDVYQDNNGVALPAQKRVVEIKGWYDEQRLDIGHPSKIRGSAFPAPGLHTFKIADFTDTWVPTAFIALSKPHQKYQGLFNYGSHLIGPGVKFAELDTIELCHGPNCNVPTSAQLNCTWGSASNDVQWWARIKSGSSDPKYKCVVRRGHEGLGDSIPGTVRWRWMGNDETVWMRCDVGCCEIH